MIPYKNQTTHLLAYEYLQVFLYDISLFSDDSFKKLFLTTISTNTNI